MLTMWASQILLGDPSRFFMRKASSLLSELFNPTERMECFHLRFILLSDSFIHSEVWTMVGWPYAWLCIYACVISCIYACVINCVISCIQHFVTPCTIAGQAPLSFGFSRQEWLPRNGADCHFLLQGIFPTQGSKLCLLFFLLWQVGSLPLSHLGSPIFLVNSYQSWIITGNLSSVSCLSFFHLRMGSCCLFSVLPLSILFSSPLQMMPFFFWGHLYLSLVKHSSQLISIPFSSLSLSLSLLELQVH